MSPHHQTRQTIVRLLSSMASAKEISQYLKRFSQLDAKRFAVVKVGGAILRDDLDALTSSLTFLQQVGLTPIVVHGAGPQLDEELTAAGIEKQTVNGLRVTSPRALAIVRKVFQTQNLKLVEALQHANARATSITAGVFESRFLDRDTYGLVGEVSAVNLAPIEASLNAGSIPIIASLGETAEGQILNINADFAANELVKLLQPYKIIFLTGTGGLLDQDGKVIDSINLSTEYEHLSAQPWINGGMKVKIEQIKNLLDALPLSSSVSITRPADLAKELFTHKGSGTLVRRGERVLRAESWDELDLDRLRALIESSFGKTLQPDYFQRTPLLRAYVSENYRAAIILCDVDGAVSLHRPDVEGRTPPSDRSARRGAQPRPAVSASAATLRSDSRTSADRQVADDPTLTYMDKFAVLDDAQGEGLGRAVWNVMREETPALFWRSRHNNQVNIFYYAQSDGCYKQDRWKVFWYGIADFDSIARCVEHCRTRPPTLIEPAQA